MRSRAYCQRLIVRTGEVCGQDLFRKAALAPTERGPQRITRVSSPISTSMQPELRILVDHVNRNSFYRNEELLQQSARPLILAGTFDPQSSLQIIGALTHSSLAQSLVNKRKARDVRGLQTNSSYRTSVSSRRYVPILESFIVLFGTLCKK